MSNKKVAIVQSNYIPWKGYFDMINMVDLFVFWDDVQYTTKSWRSRNLIKTKDGTMWLSVPCGADRKRLICEVEIADHIWQKKHWKSICFNYQKAKYFNEYRDFFSEFYLGHIWTNLSEMNHYIIRKIAAELLGITTEFDDSRRYNLQSRERQGRVLEMLEKVEAGEYLVGPTAKGYFNPEDFNKRGVRLTWMDYSGYKEYYQMYPPFVHEVSIIDLIMNEGPNARNFLKSMS